jgi:MFS family permease
MRPILEMLRAERYARLFFVAHGQSTFGNGVGYVALVLIAYDRFPSAWGITLVLLADFLPATIFGVMLGAATDRWSRRACACAADLIRAVAFISIAFVGGIEATAALALLAGFGSGLFHPAVLAGLPSLVSEERRPAAMSLYGMLTEVGVLAGSMAAALLLLAVSPEALLVGNGVSFALSAFVLARLPFAPPEQDAAAADGKRRSLFADSLDGLRSAREAPGVLTVIFAGALALMFSGVLSVVELLYATQELDAGRAGFSIFVGLLGAGIIVGNALGSRGGPVETLRRNYVIGLFLLGSTLIGMSVAPTFALACVLFVVCGIGNGMVLIYGRLLMQSSVPSRMTGRIFGLWTAMTSAAFGVAFIAAGGLAEAVGVRTVLAIGGVGGVLVATVAGPLLKRAGAGVAAAPVGAAESRRAA